jgi:hypothetical protein
MPVVLAGAPGVAQSLTRHRSGAELRGLPAARAAPRGAPGCGDAQPSSSCSTALSSVVATSTATPPTAIHASLPCTLAERD